MGEGGAYTCGRSGSGMEEAREAGVVVARDVGERGGGDRGREERERSELEERGGA